MVASVSGWIALGLMLLAGIVPLFQRLYFGKRAELGSRSVSFHIGIGMAAALVSFLHPLTAIFSLGSPGAIGGGNLGLAFGGIGFVLLLAHTGLGLRLRDPKLGRKRPRSRRAHTMTALSITAASIAHAAVIWSAGRAA